MPFKSGRFKANTVGIVNPNPNKGKALAQQAKQEIQAQEESLDFCIKWDTIKAMNTIMTTEVFDAWFAGLRDKIAKHRIQARIDLLEEGHFGDATPVGRGVSELRIHVGAGSMSGSRALW
jgi:hypothetical protein